MKQIVTQRPLHPPHIQNTINPYQITSPPQMIHKPTAVIPQPSYGVGAPILIQPQLSRPPIYAVQPPVTNYQPQYQPIYMPLGPQIQPNYPSYYYQPVLIPNKHPQYDLNPNFDYEAANFLCDSKIVENSVYCVICGSNYKGSQKEQHLKKHMRKTNQTSASYQSSLNKVAGQIKSSNKKHYITKPIVQPQQHIIMYEPLVYDLVQEIQYQDNTFAQMKDQAIGYDPSFSLQDPNLSIDRGNNIKLPNNIKTQNNPFGTTSSGLREQSNTLNQPVPFLSSVPIPKNTGPVNQLHSSGRMSPQMQSSLYPEQDKVLIERHIPQINTVKT